MKKNMLSQPITWTNLGTGGFNNKEKENKIKSVDNLLLSYHVCALICCHSNNNYVICVTSLIHKEILIKLINTFITLTQSIREVKLPNLASLDTT